MSDFFTPFPVIPVNPTNTEYFWFQLPYAIPGLISFFVGFILFGAGLYSFNQHKTRLRWFYLSFAISSLSFGSLGLVFAIRATILHLPFFYLMHTIIYPFVLMAVPSSAYFFYLLTDRKFFIAKWFGHLSWIIVFFSLYAIFFEKAFSLELYHYAFGRYPVAHLFLKLWGLTGGVGYFFIILPMIVMYYRHYPFDFAKKKTAIIGMSLLFLFTVSNLPSFSGYPVFPFGNFIFIPMLIVAIGVYNENILNINDLLYSKNILFYITNFFISFVLVALLFLLSYSYNPNTLTNLDWFPWLIFPVSSAILIFLLGIITSAANSSEKFNQMGALSLFVYGFLLLSIIFHSMGLPSIVALRLEQLCYMAFALIIVFQMRMAFLAIRIPLPRYIYFYDFVAVVISLMSLSPYLMIGYYSYYFGNIGAAGPLVVLFSIVGSVAIVNILYVWWKNKSKQTDAMGSYVVFYIIVNAILILANMPATVGIESYTYSNLIVFPTAVLSIGVLRLRSFTIYYQALKISNKMILIVLVLVPMATLTMFPAILAYQAPMAESIFYAILLGALFFLISYQSILMVFRPLAQEMSESFIATQKALSEIDRLNQVTKRINATTSIDQILDLIFIFFKQEYHIEAVILQLVDKSKDQLYSYRTTVPENASPEMLAYSRKIRIAMDSDSLLAKVIKRKKPFYLKSISHNNKVSAIDRDIILNLNLKAYLAVPLVIESEPIGNILFTSYSRCLSLSPADISSIAGFCNQIAGAIRNSFLLKQTQKAKMLGEETQKQIEILGEISKQINASTNLDEIIDQIFDFLESSTPVEVGYLALLDTTKEELFTYKISKSARFFPPEIIHYLSSYRVPLSEKNSMIIRTYYRKRPFYLAKTTKKITNEYDRKLIETLGVSSFIIVPLMLKNEVIAIAFFTSYLSTMKLTARDINFITNFSEQITGAINSSALLQQIEKEREKSDRLLLNILPSVVANELKEKGKVSPVQYESVTIMFTDFKSFTERSATMHPDDLISRLDQVFEQFDNICERNNIEKLKTIGDSYMCVGGLPNRNNTHSIDVCRAALEMQVFIRDVQRLQKEFYGEQIWDMRLGIHRGSVVAGVIGKKKFAYDIWGDAVNIASRMEAGSEAGKINISIETYQMVKEFFKCEPRGKMKVKNRGEMEMYFLIGIHPNLSKDSDGLRPNDLYQKKYEQLTEGKRT